MQLSNTCLQKLLIWIDIENKSSDIENMQYAYAFLDQYISEHNTDFNEQDLVELIKKYVVVNGQHPDHIQKAIENKVSILHGVLNANLISK